MRQFAQALRNPADLFQVDAEERAQEQADDESAHAQRGDQPPVLLQPEQVEVGLVQQDAQGDEEQAVARVAHTERPEQQEERRQDRGGVELVVDGHAVHPGEGFEIAGEPVVLELHRRIVGGRGGFAEVVDMLAVEFRFQARIVVGRRETGQHGDVILCGLFGTGVGQIALQRLHLLGVGALQGRDVLLAVFHFGFPLGERLFQRGHLPGQLLERFHGHGCLGRLEIVGAFRSPVDEDEADEFLVTIDLGDGILFQPGSFEFLEGEGIEMELAARLAQGFDLGGVEVAPVLFLGIGRLGGIQLALSVGLRERLISSSPSSWISRRKASVSRLRSRKVYLVIFVIMLLPPLLLADGGSSRSFARPWRDSPHPP